MYLNVNCTQLKITPNDSYDNGHYLLLSIENDLRVTVIEHSLPDIVNKLFNYSGNLESYAAKFFEYLDQMAPFYCHMNVLDELCFVVDPIDVNTKCNSRIIKLGIIIL